MQIVKLLCKIFEGNYPHGNRPFVNVGDIPMFQKRVQTINTKVWSYASLK